MKKSLMALAAASIAAISAQAAGTAPIDVEWIMGENFASPKQYSSQFVIKNITDNILMLILLLDLLYQFESLYILNNFSLNLLILYYFLYTYCLF